MAEQDNNSPAFVTSDAMAQMGPVKIVRDVIHGTLHLRACGTEYLPQEPAEQSEAYAIRRRSALFFNATEKTLHALVGMVFRKPPVFAEDVPVRIQAIAENIDRVGSHWAVFAKELFTDAVCDGHSFLYVDMPPALGPEATRADEIALRRVPYWVRYRKDQAINWRFDDDGNLAQITFREVVMEPSGAFGEEAITYYRVLHPGSWELYREQRDDSGKKTIILVDSGTTSLRQIPLAVVYSRKEAEMLSKPPLLDLALLNVGWYQKYSDYSTYLHIASRPILWFRGRDKTKAVEAIGPYTFFDVDGDAGEVAFAETTGAALGAARQDLIDIQEWMAKAGLAILATKVPTQTATESLLDHVREDSDLATAARSLQDALELALAFTAEYLGLPEGGSVELGATVEEMVLTAQEIQAYSAMVATNQLSLETMWEVLGAANRLPEDFDQQAELQRIETARAEAEARQQRTLGDAMLGFDRGGAAFPA